MQKTAYEVRISDWSSDVCSSDLGLEGYFGHVFALGQIGEFKPISVNPAIQSQRVDCSSGSQSPIDAGLGVAASATQRCSRTICASKQDMIMMLGHRDERSEEHTSELQSLMRISYAVFCLKKKNKEKKIR